MTESVFFQDMAVVMAIAGFAAALFSRFGWPKVFGYILVGVLMNGHTWGGAFLTDTTSISTISQLGLVFLMLTMGLEFSTSDMKRIKNVTFPTALLDVAVMVWLGYSVGTKILGWPYLPSLFLGVAICDSATTLLAKMIGEFGWSRRPFVKYTLGTSVCEDILCVGLIALVTGLATGTGMSIGAVGLSLGGLMLFFFATIVFGLVFVPRLLQSLAKRKDDEALILTFLGLCFFISWIAYKKDYSLALGAFLVGILGASSEVKGRLHQLVQPLRAMFAAMFFVSIGLLVDPRACAHNIGTILLVTAVVIGGKSVNCFLGGVLTGLPLRSATQMALALAQTGEFAFMVALVYVTCTGDASKPFFQVAIGVSMLTTLLNPVFLRVSDPVGEWLERRCPKRVRRGLETYRAFLERYRREGADDARRRVRRAVFELFSIGVLALSVALVCASLYRVNWSRFSILFERYDQYFFLAIFNLYLAILLVPQLRVMRTLAEALNEVIVGSGEARWKPPVRNLVRLFVYVTAGGAFLVMAFMLNTVVAPHHPAVTLGILAVGGVASALGWKYLRRASQRATVCFEEALSVDRRLADLEAMMRRPDLDGVGGSLTVGPDSPAIGQTVVTLDIRAKTGASVVAVTRGGRTVRNIGPDWRFEAGDLLDVLGDEGQVAALRALVENLPKK